MSRTQQQILGLVNAIIEEWAGELELSSDDDIGMSPSDARGSADVFLMNMPGFCNQFDQLSGTLNPEGRDTLKQVHARILLLAELHIFDEDTQTRLKGAAQKLGDRLNLQQPATDHDGFGDLTV